MQLADPIAVESRYVELFDRGRSTSLHLFEHVHGDSRDRGPAMVDLVKHYEAAGLFFDGKELPDHLCVVLEFASTQPPAQAREFLGEVAHILQALFTALRQRESAYASLVAGVLELAGQKAEAVPVTPDEALDASWEEPQAFGGCSTQGQAAPGQPQPIQIVRRPGRRARSTHMKALDLFLFGFYPYIALVVFLLGSLIRFDREQYTWKSDSSQLLRAGQLRWGSNLFHVGVLFLFFGHTVGMLTPHFLYEPFLGAGSKQLMAMVSGGIAGLLGFAGVSILLHRRLTDPRIRINSRPGDIFLLVLLWVQLALGLATIPLSAQHLDGSMMIRLAEWASASSPSAPARWTCWPTPAGSSRRTCSWA
jgi:respiratory nitrate reductase gamma subunit/nitrate reductase molybdenum cofactor assembly chaperone